MPSIPKLKPKKCPKCKQIYTEYPALSRRDNKTYICPDCGTMEAMEDLAKSREIEKVKDWAAGYKARKKAGGN
jgi:transposase-like protein